MHGSPLLRTMWVMLALLVAGIPLWRLTHAQAAQDRTGTAPAASAAAATPAAVRLEAAFARQPVRFSVLHLGRPIWSVEKPDAPTQSRQVNLPAPADGIELEYRVEWPAGTGLTAARLSVATGTGEPVERTLWGTDSVDDVLTFR